LFPKLKLIVEYGPKDSVKFYPIELLEIVEEEPKESTTEKNGGWTEDNIENSTQWYQCFYRFVLFINFLIF
jgi:hypothetical protein